MASINKKVKVFTHEGAVTSKVNHTELLKRSVMSCLLWEDNFYEDGKSVSDLIIECVSNVKPEIAYNVAIEARNKSKLRHVPLLIARQMAKLPTHKHLVGKLLPEIIQRPDELTEFLAIYWKDGKQSLSNQVKTGLANAFKKFNEYSLAKYNRDGAIKLRDVLFLSHPKPDNQAQQDLWNRLVKNELIVPDTWEVELSANGNNKASWERLLTENKLGCLALIRNLRNMVTVNVDRNLIKTSILNTKTDRVLPFRFVASARYAPDFEPELEVAMFKSLENKDKIKGRTILLVDVSGSMEDMLSGKSEMKRGDAAYGLSILARELCEDVSVYSFSNSIVKIPPRRGFALRDAINNSQVHSSTNTGEAVKWINKNETYDRLIIITDEQSNSTIENPKGKGYIINVACYENGIGYGAYTHINGWSESVLDYIIESEVVDVASKA